MNWLDAAYSQHLYIYIYIFSEGQMRLTGIERNSIGGDRSGALLPNLEPNSARTVKSSGSRRRFGHIDGERARMEDRNIGDKPNAGTSSDGGCRRLGSVCKRADVTSHVSGLDVRDGGVGVGVGPDVDIFTTDGTAADELEEAV